MLNDTVLVSVSVLSDKEVMSIGLPEIAKEYNIRCESLYSPGNFVLQTRGFTVRGKRNLSY